MKAKNIIYDTVSTLGLVFFCMILLLIKRFDIDFNTKIIFLGSAFLLGMVLFPILRSVKSKLNRQEKVKRHFS